VPALQKTHNASHFATRSRRCFCCCCYKTYASKRLVTHEVTSSYILLLLLLLLPVKTEWWGAGVVICLERGADLHMAQLMPLPLTVSCFSKIQIDFTFLVPVHPGSPGQRAVKRVCVCCCCCCRCRRRRETGDSKHLQPIS